MEEPNFEIDPVAQKLILKSTDPLTVAEQEALDALTRKAPDKPTNINPLDEDVDIEERPILDGSTYYHYYDYELYMVQFEVYDANDNLVLDTGALVQTRTSYHLLAGVLLAGQSYHWRVRYCGANMVWSEWSEWTSFTTAAAFPAVTINAPNIISPGNNRVINTVNPTITTDPFDEGSGQTQGDGSFQISDRSDFSNIVDEGAGMNSYTSGTALTRGVSYYARANHKNKDGSITSRWSGIVSFAVREYYRKKRAGFVIDNEFNLSRIDDNFEPLSVDADYWMFNPIYASLQATKDQFKTIGAKNHYVATVPSFFIRNGIVPSGPLAGHRFWMYDTDEPSDSDKAAGWHLHGMFQSAEFGDQDSVLITHEHPAGTDYQSMESRQYVQVAGTAYATNILVIDQWLNLLANTDPNDPERRGWGVATYIHLAGLRLLGMFYAGSLSRYVTLFVSGRDTNRSGSLFGMYLMPFVNSSFAVYLSSLGLCHNGAILPGSKYDEIQSPITPLLPTEGPANTPYPVNDICKDEDGPELMHLGDYLIGKYDSGGGMGSTEPLGSAITCSNTSIKQSVMWNNNYPSPLALRTGVDANSNRATKLIKYS